VSDDQPPRRDAREAHAAITIDPRSKILMQSDAIDKFQAWQAATDSSRR